MRFSVRKAVILHISAAVLSSCAVSEYAANPAYPRPETGYTCLGRLEEVFCSSSTGGPQQRRMFVYLPEGYEADDTRYPVLYLLHGARGNELSWMTKGRLLQNADSLSRCGAMEKTIIVLPNMNQYDDQEDEGRSRRKSALESIFEIDGCVESGFMNDVVAVTDSMFRTVRSKKGRAIAGLSIGAFQAMYISASAPDAFDYVGLFSPFTRTIIRHSPCSGIYRNLRTGLDRQFENPPEGYMIMTGKGDIFEPRIRQFLIFLERRGYTHEYHLSKGGHNWDNWERYSIRFMQGLWK